MSEFTRPPGWRFAFKGVNTRSSPDALPPDKYAAGVNIRPTSDQSIRVRPGLVPIFNANNTAVTDVRTYAAIETDDKPRILARTVDNKIWLDNGNLATTLNGNNALGVSMIPFRPAASPQAWMYIATAEDYQKVSAPDANNNTIAFRVGIAEPQAALQAGVIAPTLWDFSASSGNWAANGTASAVASGVRSADTAGNAIPDPVIASRYSVQTANNIEYQIGELVTFGNSNNTILVQDVIPAIADIGILGIYYYTGTSGPCVIVPSQLPAGQEPPGIPQLGFLRPGALVQLGGTEIVRVNGVTSGPDGSLAFDTSTVGTFAAGASITGVPTIVVDGGSTGAINAAMTTFTQSEGVGWVEQIFVVNPFTVAGAMQLDDYIHFSVNVEDPTQIVEIQIQFNIDPSDPTMTQNFLYYSIGPNALANIATGGATISSVTTTTTTTAANAAQIASLEAAIAQLQVVIQTAPWQAVPSIQAQINDLQSRLSALQSSSGSSSSTTTTEAGTAQWTEVMFPISALTRIGNDQTKTLNHCTRCRIWVNTSGAGEVPWESGEVYQVGQVILDPANHSQKVTVAGTAGVVAPTWNDTGGTTTDGSVTWQDEGISATATTTIEISSLWVGGRSQPDVGDTGAPYNYWAEPRSSLTGALGNPTPPMRYGVSPRRQEVLVKTSAVPTGGDPQIDLLDVYRYGGSLTTSRYIGTVPVGDDFYDNYFDDTAQAGAPLTYQNYEPWPSIDVPFKSTAGTVLVVGTVIVVTDATVTWPDLILSWLGGTLLTIGGQQTYTLRARPIQLSATSYLFYIQECAGYVANAGQFWVNEPIVARQFAPYMDGPDSTGTFFATGEKLRPGGVYFAAAFAPDEAPQTNFIELPNPSEPLTRPFVLAGVTLVASTIRWWALYPNFTQAGNYTPYELAVGRAVISPFGCCSDKANVYFWTKDGICKTSGGPYVSLTDADLYNLFPHEGVEGEDVVRNGVTFYAPDYAKANTFRLGVVNNFLFADYPQAGNTTPALYCFTIQVTDASNNTASVECCIQMGCP